MPTSPEATIGSSRMVLPHPVASTVVTPGFEEVYEQHFSFVWRNVRRLGVHPDQVDDAVQEVFLIVHRRLSQFEGRSSLRSWLFGIVSNVVRDFHRTSRRKDPRKKGEGPTVDDLEDERGRSPEDSAELADAVRIIHSLLETLDWQKREAFVLVELEQMSIPEVAEALGENENTVYSRLRAARKAFNEALVRFQAREGRMG